ncbi:MAG: GAF domain-containing protein [Actinobacteria bacterium]|nr:GAF domain-containing protein [Actinomycetota bacterium]MSW78170.1 GAF domain-containing protein [Actinomycetota bacterium]MSX54351.1 GAF domain-containing protein [Actinomycetota bacterium]MSX91875.1 GAF domain-containing protein [Actinomycetota bacterium]MSZ83885.1 GAF domain-containing protein [Actinomycetota bacterium]
MSWGDNPPGQGPAGTVLRTGSTHIVHDLRSDTSFEPWRTQAHARGFRSLIGVPVVVDRRLDGALCVYAAELDAFDVDAVHVLEELATQVGIGLARLRTMQQLTRSLAQQSLLMTAIDQAADSVIVTDATRAIVYANPGACETTGYSLDAMLGRNPRLFQSGLHDRSFYQAMWGRLLGGQPFRGVLVNRRRSGEIYEDDTTITPVHDDDGSLVAYVAVKHDLTDQAGLAGFFPEVSLPMVAAGFTVSAYAPIHWEGTAVGAIAVTTRSGDAPAWIDSRLRVLEELGGFAGMLFGARVQQFGDFAGTRTQVREILELGLFHPVSQPVVDLHTGEVRGYEALTRFDDDVRPDTRIAAAHTVGLGSELEAACARAAIVGATALDPAMFLSINFSPATLIDGTAADVLRTAARPIVVEVTEHLEIQSYPAARRAIRDCGGGQVAAEGAMLRELGVDLAQGYLYGYPVQLPRARSAHSRRSGGTCRASQLGVSWGA